MTDYEPLYIDGKRDSRRRYISPDGEIISRRQYIKLVEGVSPETKAVIRYLEGKTDIKGVTVQQYEKRLKRRPNPTQDKIGYRKPPKDLKGLYQLQGYYILYNPATGEVIHRPGYSNARTEKARGNDLWTLREQATEQAKAGLESYDWIVVGVEQERWLLW